MVDEKSIVDAYCLIRKIDQTIPDEVLDFMLDASIQRLKLNEAVRKYKEEKIKDDNHE